MLPRKFYFDDFMDSLMESDNNSMKCDIYEKDNNFVIEMDLPGFNKEDIKLECNKGNVIISGIILHLESIFAEKPNKNNMIKRNVKG